MWSISLKEIERFPRVSVIEITTTGRPKSVGGSITLGCMMVKLARERDLRYLAQTSDAGVKKIGGLEKLDGDAAKSLGVNFAGIDAKNLELLLRILTALLITIPSVQQIKHQTLSRPHRTNRVWRLIGHDDNYSLTSRIGDQ